MADETSGIEKLRDMARRIREDNGCRPNNIIGRSGCPQNGNCNECIVEAGEYVESLAADIEREHAEELAAAKRDLIERGGKVGGSTSDGYHTFDELYRHRAVLFSVIVSDRKDVAWKSKLHHDGTMYDGMFIVGIDTPQGQATYHYDVDACWDMFDCRELDCAPEWDGHTPDMAIGRILSLRGGQRANAAADWVERHGGLDEVKARMKKYFHITHSVLEELGLQVPPLDDQCEMIVAELDKRLLPPGMEWPRMVDGSRLAEDNAPDGVFAAVLGLNGEEFALIDNIPVFDATHCLVVAEHGEPIELPEPEALGADGLPIKVGETVWHNDVLFCGPLRVVGRDDYIPGRFVCQENTLVKYGVEAYNLTHTHPDTQERIDEDARQDVLSYWRCKGVDCDCCPSEIDGETPRVHYGVDKCSPAHRLDLLRRQRELDARTMGGAL